MEQKEILRIDAIVMSKEEHRSVTQKGNFWSKFKSIDAYDYVGFLKSEYRGLVSAKPDEIIVICKSAINGSKSNSEI